MRNKSEIRISKSETKLKRINYKIRSRLVWNFPEFSSFEFVSNFGFRISNL